MTRTLVVMASRPKQGRNEQVIRLFAIIRTLYRRGRCDIYELANQHGTTTRTILRDLDALEAAGLPLAKELDGRKMKWRIEYDDQLRDLTRLLDTSHYLAVIAALGTGGATTRSRTAREALQDLATKVANSLSPGERKRYAAAAKAFGSPGRQQLQHQSGDLLGPLVSAIGDSKLCDVHYTSVAGRRSQMTVLPLRLFPRQDALYLLAYLPKRDDVLTLAVHRIRSMLVTDRRHKAPVHVDVDRHVDSLFGVDGSGDEVTYRLRFDKIVAPYLHERVWHPSQQLRTGDDRGVELTFTCRESVEVSAWVASWREHVEVIAPERLRIELAQLGSLLARRYAV